MAKYPSSKTEIEPKEIMKYILRLIKEDVPVEEINEILKKIGIEFDPLS